MESNNSSLMIVVRCVFGKEKWRVVLGTGRSLLPSRNGGTSTLCGSLRQYQEQANIPRSRATPGLFARFPHFAQPSGRQPSHEYRGNRHSISCTRKQSIPRRTAHCTRKHRFVMDASARLQSCKHSCPESRSLRRLSVSHTP